MEKYGTVKTAETQDFCFQIPEIRNATKVLELPQNRQDFSIVADLKGSIVTIDDQKIYDNFLIKYGDFKTEWKKWIDTKTKGVRTEFQDICNNRVNLKAASTDLNMEMLKERSMYRAPSIILADQKNKCFPGIDLIYQLRQDDGFLKPSEEFRNEFLKKMRIVPDKEKTIDRPSFDKMPGMVGNFKCKLKGVYFEVENKPDGKITAFFEMPTLIKMVEETL